MSKSILLFVLSLFSIVSVYGGDIRIPAKGGGLYQVVIVDRKGQNMMELPEPLSIRVTEPK